MPDKIQIVASQGSRAGQRILSLTGPLNIQTIFDFQTAMRAETSPALIVDFSGVTFIDSAGLGALVGVCVAAQKANRKVALAAMDLGTVHDGPEGARNGCARRPNGSDLVQHGDD
jgi:anti-anti-sigma factor